MACQHRPGVRVGRTSARGERPTHLRLRMYTDDKLASMSERPATPTANLEYFVSDMDCAECARTVRGAIGTLAGARDVRVNFTTQTLRLTLDEARTPRASLERDLTRLGYPPRLKGGEVVADAPGGAVAGGAYGGPETPPAWYRTAKGRFGLAPGPLPAGSALRAPTFPRPA